MCFDGVPAICATRETSGFSTGQTGAHLSRDMRDSILDGNAQLATLEPVPQKPVRPPRHQHRMPIAPYLSVKTSAKSPNSSNHSGTPSGANHGSDSGFHPVAQGNVYPRPCICVSSHSDQSRNFCRLSSSGTRDTPRSLLCSKISLLLSSRAKATG